jgi:prepilin-type N-terminal cleavage/methylation domain-containing protein
MMPAKSIQSKRREVQAFTLTELLFAVAIVAILSAVAVPKFFSQLLITRQRGCASTLSMVQTSTMLFNDEYSEPPRHWADLHTMSPLLTSSGTAAEINNFDPIPLRDENYELSGLYLQGNPIYTFTCTPIATNIPGYNAIGCVNIDTGASDLVQGRKNEPATSVNCN